eukprot:gene17857-19637_t
MSYAEHQDRFETVLGRLKVAGLSIKLNKCQWAKPKVKYLGHLINAVGVSSDLAKMVAVEDFPVPGNRTDVRASGLSFVLWKVYHKLCKCRKTTHEPQKNDGASGFSMDR